MFKRKTQKFLTGIFAILSYLFVMYLFFFVGDDFTNAQRNTWEIVSSILTGLFGFFLIGSLKLFTDMEFEKWQMALIQSSFGAFLFALNFLWWQTDFAPVAHYTPRQSSQQTEIEQTSKPEEPFNDYPEIVSKIEKILPFEVEEVCWFQNNLVTELPDISMPAAFDQYTSGILKRPSPYPEAFRLITEKKFYQAKQSFKKAIRQNQDRENLIRYYAALAFTHSAKFDLAKEMLGQIDRLFINNPKRKFDQILIKLIVADFFELDDKLYDLLELVNGDKPTSKTIAVMNLQALFKMEQGQFDNANDILEDARTIATNSIGSDHFITLSTVNNLALLKLVQGRIPDAESLALQLKFGAERRFEKTAPEYIQSINTLAQVWMFAGNFNNAEKICREVLLTDQQYSNQAKALLADINTTLAKVVMIQNRLDEAETNLKRASGIGEIAHGGEHPKLSVLLGNLAGTQAKLSKLEDAGESINRAVNIAKSSYGVHHPYYAMILGTLGVIDQKREQFENSETNFKRAIKILEAAYPNGHPRMAVVFNNYASMLKEINRHQEASDTTRRAIHLFRQAFGEEHSWTQVAKRNLIDIKKDIQRINEEQEEQEKE